MITSEAVNDGAEIVLSREDARRAVESEDGPFLVILGGRCCRSRLWT